MLYGKVVDKENQEPIVGVHILNFTNYTGTVTDRGGNFRMMVEAKDSLGLSAIGYDNEIFEVLDAHLTVNNVRIFMKTRVYNLDGVTVYPWRNEREFKEHFLNLDVPDTSSYVNLRIGPRPDVLPSETDLGFGVAFEGVFTNIYQALSRKHRHRKKYTAIIQNEKYQKELQKRYNKEIVSRLIGIDDEVYLTAFMDFCRLSDDFIERSLDYEFYLSIIDCFHHYNRVNSIE